MPYPTQTFPNFAALMAYINQYIITNGLGLIEGVEHNNVENGLLTFIEQSPLNWATAEIVSSGGNVVAPAPVTVFLTTTPTGLTWNDNIYNEYVFINMTSNNIPLSNSMVYYNTSGQAVNYIPANSSVDIFKASNDLWVQGYVSGTSTGTAQKQPMTYVVGSTPNAPTAGTNTWQLPTFANSWVILVIARSIFVDMTNAGDGGPYITKALASDTLTINNYTFQTGDILSYILITP